MFNRRSLGMVAMAAILGAGVAGMSQPTPLVTMNAPRKAKHGLFGSVLLGPSTNWGYGGPGITMAQQKRAARKRRNRARHKSSGRCG